MIIVVVGLIILVFCCWFVFNFVDVGFLKK